MKQSKRLMRAKKKARQNEANRVAIKQGRALGKNNYKKLANIKNQIKEVEKQILEATANDVTEHSPNGMEITKIGDEARDDRAHTIEAQRESDGKDSMLDKSSVGDVSAADKTIDSTVDR